MKGSGSFLDFAGADARGANANTLRCSTHGGAHTLQIGVPTAAPRIVCVAHHVAVLGTFAAQFTLHSHKLFLLR
jgi:hypothetical protein